MKNIPKVRFPEFRDAPEWEQKKLGDLTKINQGLQIPISERYTEQIDNSYFYITNEFLKEESTNRYFIKNPPESVICHEDDILMTRTGNTGQVVTNVHGAFHNNFFKIKYSSEINKDFLVYFLKLPKTQSLIMRYAGISTIPDLNHGDFYRLEIRLPNIKEQQKIAECLSSVDALIGAQSSKVEALKAHKKALMQQLFPSDGETTPRLRFPEFRDDGEWEEKKLGDLLDYEQPTNYLVNDTNYDDSFEVPVLTAGKTFILGYTNETHGIFQNPLPVIIFDDFTTATQFVDFPFKAKSSAMKILKPKNNFGNIKIIFELMQTIKYQADEHKRYWISEYQDFEIRLPSKKEQQKIAECLSSLDVLIAAQTVKVEALKQHKKALMQQLFPPK